MRKIIVALSALLVAGSLSSCASAGDKSQSSEVVENGKGQASEPVKVSDVALTVDTIGRYVITGTLTNTAREEREATLTISVTETKTDSNVGNNAKTVGISNFTGTTNTGIFLDSAKKTSIRFDPKEKMQVVLYPLPESIPSDKNILNIVQKFGLDLHITYDNPQITLTSTAASSATDQDGETCGADDMTIAFSPLDDSETEVTVTSKDPKNALNTVIITLYGTDSDGVVFPLGGFYGDEKARPVGMHTVDVSFDRIGPSSSKTDKFMGYEDWKIAEVTCTK